MTMNSLVSIRIAALLVVFFAWSGVSAAACEPKVIELHRTIDIWQKKHASLEGAFKVAADKIDGLEDELTAANANIETLSKELSALNSKYTADNDTIKELDRQAKLNQTYIADLEKDNEFKNVRIAELLNTQSKPSLNNDVNTKSKPSLNNNDVYDLKIKNLTQTLQEVREGLRESLKAEHAHKVEIAELKKQRDEYHDEFAEQLIEKQDYEELSRTLKKDVKAEVRILEERLQNMEKHIAQRYEDKIKRLEEQLKSRGQ